jgi:putative exporter of polyketide antibiotics
MRRHLEGWRARAENLRATALKRVQEMPGTAVSALATGSRAQLQTIARGLAEISRRLEETPAKKNGSAGTPATTAAKSA